MKLKINFMVFSALVMGGVGTSGSVKAEEKFLSDHYVKIEGGAYLTRETGRMPFKDQLGNSLELASDDLGTGAVFGVGVGTRFSENVRADITFNYRIGSELSTNENFATSGSPTTADLRSFGLMANAFFDVAEFKVDEISFVPYLGGGVGLVVNDLGYVREVLTGGIAVWEGDTKTNMAWQLGAGVGVGLSETLSIDAGYRYVDLGKIHSGVQIASGTSGRLQKKIQGDYITHELTLALRYSF